MTATGSTIPVPPSGDRTVPLRRFALLGNPNTGKSTLFNRLCGLAARTANFPGSTVEAHVGRFASGPAAYEIVDLPGIYSLGLDRPETRVCRHYLRDEVRGIAGPDALLVVLDATNLRRNLVLAAEALLERMPTVVALNMSDLAQRRGLQIDAQRLAARLGCPVVPISARSGAGLDRLRTMLDAPVASSADLPDPRDVAAAGAWADRILEESVKRDPSVETRFRTVTDRLDAAFTHPLLGLVAFVAIMAGLFWTIFSLASVPMDLIELVFAHLGSAVGAIMPEGAIRDLLVDGVVGGVAGTVVFLPQICLLFFLISLLEDTGYLVRAAFVMDRLLRRFGLPGQSFIPFLTAHACAIPALMSARLIPDHRDRLATILVAPFLSCSARLPVYVLLIGMLFPDDPFVAGAAFAGCYLLGAVAALLTALIFRRTVLRGPSRPMVLEFPTYKVPSLRNALVVTWDRASVFLRKAGTVIMGICIVLWWLGAYPHVAPPPAADALRAEAAAIADAAPERAEALDAEADQIASRHAIRSSFVGRLGRFAEPVLAPIGCDWQLSVGVLSSFLAREVFVSSLVVVVSGEELDDDEAVRTRILTATRDDGTPLLTRRSAASLLVYFVLAMQCLPTLAVTRRETGSWAWAGLQLGWMTVVAYALALATYHGLGLFGVA